MFCGCVIKIQAIFWLLLAGLLTSQSTGQRIHTVEIGSSRYFISNASPYSPTLNWFLANQYCRNIVGMELLSLEQSEEALEIRNFLRENNYITTEYWTSGNQLGSAMWLWMSTGQPFNSTFNNWAAGGPPLTKSEQSCMSTLDSTWSPHNCMDSKAFICEQTRCFYYNYVTTNRASSQGNSSILPGVTRVTNRPQASPRPIQLPTSRITPRPTRTNTQDRKDQTQQIPSADPKVSTTQMPKILVMSDTSTLSPSVDSTDLPPQVTVIPSENPEDTKVMTGNTQQQVKVMPGNTPQQVKVMPGNTPQQVKVMPGNTQQQVKVMPAIRPIIDDPSIDTTNNEIVPTDPNLSLRLLQPPSQEFQPGEHVADVADSSVNLMEILSRKETFSWALQEEDTTDQPSV